MDKSFETVIMGTYTELCVSWRMAHVANLVQADDLSAKLTSLESVIKSFDLVKGQRAGEAPRPAPAKAGERPGAISRKAAPAKSPGVILED